MQTMINVTTVAIAANDGVSYLISNLNFLLAT